MTTTVKPVTWFEIGSADPAATREFYGRLFGWTFTGDDDSGMDYTMINAGEGIKGGIFGTHGELPNYAVFYVEVPDVATTCREVDEAGGKVLVDLTNPIDGDDHIMQAGSIAYVPAGHSRRFTTPDQGVQFLAIGGTPGAPFSDVIAAREKATTT